MPLRDDERYTAEETYQRRIDTGEWKPNVMTEDERLEQRRMDAGSAFEMGHPVHKRSRLDHFGQGLTDHLPKERVTASQAPEGSTTSVTNPDGSVTIFPKSRAAFAPGGEGRKRQWDT